MFSVPPVKSEDLASQSSFQSDLFAQHTLFMFFFFLCHAKMLLPGQGPESICPPLHLWDRSFEKTMNCFSSTTLHIQDIPQIYLFS